MAVDGSDTMLAWAAMHHKPSMLAQVMRSLYSHTMHCTVPPSALSVLHGMNKAKRLPAIATNLVCVHHEHRAPWGASQQAVQVAIQHSLHELLR